MQRRQAALQQCGLVPLPRKDLSRLEQELDQKFSHVIALPQDQPEQGELSTAEKIRREWQANNENQPVTQSGDVDPEDPNGLTSDTLNPARLGESDSTRDAEVRKALEVPLPPSPQTALDPTTPISIYSIPGSFLFHDIPEEEVIPPEIEKVRCPAPIQPLPLTNSKIVKLLPPTLPAKPVDPLTIPLPDSPSSSSAELSEIPPTPSPRESRRPPPIVIDSSTDVVTEATGEVTRGRSPDRRSARSLTTKSSLPALSPTMTTSTFSSIPTPRDDESRERMEAMITRSGSGKSRSRPGKVSDTGRDSDDLGVVHETIPESPEPTITEPKTWNPNRESSTTLGAAGFEAFAEKREKRKMFTGVFQPNKRRSGSSSRKSASSELSLRWSAITNDFSLKPLDGARPRSSTLPVSAILCENSLVSNPPYFQTTPPPAGEKSEPTPVEPQPAVEQPQSKMTRSKSVIASLGLRMTRRAAPPPPMPPLPPTPSTPPRRPTVMIVQNRGALIQNMEGIEDEESRRLTGLAFDF